MNRPDLAKRPAEVSSMFDRVAGGYDLTNDLLSVGCAPSWRRQTRLALEPVRGEHILDVACGTGTVTRTLAGHGATVTGLDFSSGMISKAISRHATHPAINFVQGDATGLPFEDNTFAATTVSFGIRNVQKPQLALAEMLRVTKPGGKIVVCEFSTPPNWLIRDAYNTYMRTIMPLLVKIVSSDPEAYNYLFSSILDWPNQQMFAQQLREVGFENVAYRNLTLGIVALHRGTKPEQ